GDTTTAGMHSDAPPADEWDQLADHSKPAPARYATGLIVIATAIAAGTASYLWSSHQGTNPLDKAYLVSATSNPNAPLDQARQSGAGARAVAEQPSPPPDSARQSFYSPSDEARLRERARQLTIKVAHLWQVDAPARLIVSATDAPADVDVVISGLATGTVLSL